MTTVHRLQPHDPVPEHGHYGLLMRRFGEDDPRAAVVEFIVAGGGGPSVLSVLSHPNGRVMSFEEAIVSATHHAQREKLPVLYIVDRTAGPEEQQALAHDGDRTIDMAKFKDTDDEIDEVGSDVRNRPFPAG